MVTTAPLPADLPAAIASALAGYGVAELRSAVERLIVRYHDPDETQMVRTTLDAAAYVAYRMPATCAVVGRVLEQYGGTDPDFVPTTLVDVGGGTGAAVWAVADRWPSVSGVRVVDRSPQMCDLGRAMAATAESPAVRGAAWEQITGTIGESVTTADVVTASYVLGELTERDQASLADAIASHAQVAVVVEPGTPDGYRRILAARSAFIKAGMRIAAPCPHDLACPLADDWCHFAARVNRSSVHRQVKRADLGHEDEKYAYVVATRRPIAPAPQRILRRPRQRKGLVQLTLCAVPPRVERRTVTRRDGEMFKRAKGAHWGDPWW